MASSFASDDRITGAIDTSQITLLRAQPRHNLVPMADLGPVNPALPIAWATLYLQTGPGLEDLLASQQNPSSPDYHRWLTPEQFGDRFGLSASDAAKITGWLQSQGFAVHDIARGRHWITFSATAAQVSQAFHTEIHRYLVNGEEHFAAATDLSIPAALDAVVAGVAGLDDFRMQPYYTQASKLETPDIDNGSVHYLGPDDLATIYDIGALYAKGIDGTGQKLAIVGQTDVNLSDIRAFRTRFNLPANDPQIVLYGPDPGTRVIDVVEADLDLEVSGAIARNATIVFVNSSNVNLSAQYAVDRNLAPVMSMSYGACEISSVLTLRSIAQQANAQGITWIASSGDSGAATCDRTSPTPQAEKGATVSFPASLPEVTAVGGTTLNDTAGAYWAPANNANLASALSYIPELVWNDSALENQLVASGGGPSSVYPKPLWQTGPGVPGDGARDLPDISFASSAAHDAYQIVSTGFLYSVGGTSAASPLFAGMVALLNQAVAPAGLGNINPLLYRLAQSTADVFHDITNGDNLVPCAQGSPNCVNGLLGYAAGPGYDLATGLGSIDAAHLIAEWNTGNNSTTYLSVNPASIAPGIPVQLTASVSGTGAIPTGTVTFVGADVTLGTVALTSGTAALSVDGILLAGGSGTVGALYSGDGNFLPSSGSSTVTLQMPGSGSLAIPSITPYPVTQVGAGWPYLMKISEFAGVATTITAFTINGVNNLPGLPTRLLAANASISAGLQGNGLAVPINRVFHFEGIDASGATWARDLTVPFVAAQGSAFLAPSISLTLSPSTVQQNPQADPSCQWSQQAILQELGGFEVSLSGFAVGSSTLTSILPQVFGTTRLAPHGVLSGTMCFANLTAPSQKIYTLAGAAETGALVSASATATFAGAPAGAANFSLPAGPLVISNGAAAVPLSFGTGAPSWTATVIPAAAQKWLTLSAPSGVGNSTLTLQASAAGLSNGVYNATLSIEAANSVPQTIQVPVIFAVGASPNISIAGISNAASGVQIFAPGELIAIYGNGLASTTAIAGIQPLPFTLASVSATVNGVSAPLWFVSPAQINLQIPYETAAGPAVLGVMNNGQLAYYAFNVAPVAPGIFASQGSMVPEPSGAPGQTLVGFITGDGDVTPTLASGASALYGTPLSLLPHSRAALSMTIGGEPANIVFNGIAPGLIGVTQVNFTIPADMTAGPQPVVVTVGGVSSAPVNLTVI